MWAGSDAPVGAVDPLYTKADISWHWTPIPVILKMGAGACEGGNLHLWAPVAAARRLGVVRHEHLGPYTGRLQAA